MRKSEKWVQLQSEFHALDVEEERNGGDRTVDRFLRAHGDYETDEQTGGEWFLSEGTVDGIRTKFEFLATNAGRLLTPAAPRNIEPMHHWLESLRTYLLRERSRLISAQIITRVCRASAILCTAQAKAAVETEPIEQPAEESPRQAVAPVQPKRRFRDRGQIEEVRILIRNLLSEGTSHQDICRRLGGMPRPSNAAWRHLDWDKAFLDNKYRTSVRKWISQNCRP